MPAPLAVDWEAVKTTALATGSLAEAARLHDIPHDAVKQRAKRGSWMIGRRAVKAAAAAKTHTLAVQTAARTAEGRVTSVTVSPSDALERHMAETRDEFRTQTATAIRNASRAAGRLSEDDALDSTKRLGELVTAGCKLHGLGGESAPVVSVQVLNQW